MVSFATLTLLEIDWWQSNRWCDEQFSKTLLRTTCSHTAHKYYISVEEIVRVGVVVTDAVVRSRWWFLTHAWATLSCKWLLSKTENLMVTSDLSIVWNRLSLFCTLSLPSAWYPSFLPPLSGRNARSVCAFLLSNHLAWGRSSDRCASVHDKLLGLPKTPVVELWRSSTYLADLLRSTVSLRTRSPLPDVSKVFFSTHIPWDSNRNSPKVQNQHLNFVRDSLFIVLERLTKIPRSPLKIQCRFPWWICSRATLSLVWHGRGAQKLLIALFKSAAVLNLIIRGAAYKEWSSKPRQLT